ncbi:hypothetical protein [Promicromonospora sp. NPDC050880]|uniref:hypothetical protein n=1 Tax=Promicromonospora sp. NPDC050880 TaxID=3364406 RepID=UPI003790BFB1
MIPAGYFPAAPVTCVHVGCAGDVCRYVPPAIGPELPRRITTADGAVWTRHGDLYYGPRNGEGGLVATWKAVAGAGAGRPIFGAVFPAGAWEVAA